MGAGESKPSQKEHTELTTQELIKKWKANPDIKRLENYIQHLIKHMKDYYKELLGTDSPTPNNRDFCKQFKIFVKSEVLSYISEEQLNAYFKKYIKDKSISSKDIGIGVCRDPVDPQSDICVMMANYYTKRLNIALAIQEAIDICNLKFARLEEREICYSDKVTQEKIDHSSSLKGEKLGEINVSPVEIRNQAASKLLAKIKDDGSIDEEDVKHHLLVSEAIHSEEACKAKGKDKKSMGLWGRNLQKISRTN